MNTNEKERLIKKHSPKSPIIKNMFFAFLFGGIICAFGEIIFLTLSSFFSEEDSQTLVTLIIIFIAAALTGFGVFDKIARVAGAGTLLPVSGFSNAVVSEALDSRSEGFILGVGAKIFTVAGPVILYGISSGVIYGIIYYFYTLFLE